MKFRLVVELEYPNAVHVTDEEEVKSKVAEIMLMLAKAKGFTVRDPGELPALEVSEIMVGCARMEEAPDAKEPTARREIDVYGDEDGDMWFASGHFTVDEMVAGVLAWEADVADAIPEEVIDRKSYSAYHVIPDPDSDKEDRYKIVDPCHPGAEPMTSIRRL